MLVICIYTSEHYVLRGQNTRFVYLLRTLTLTHTQVEAISRDWASRAALPQHVVQMVNNFPSALHPMSQFSAGITAMQSESKFAKAYNEGVAKTKYWEVRETINLSPFQLVK